MQKTFHCLVINFSVNNGHSAAKQAESNCFMNTKNKVNTEQK